MFGLLRKKDKIDRRWVFGALVAYIAMLVVNWLGGSTTILGGMTTAEVSDAYPNLFAPAGVTFAIWGVIYLLLGLFFFRAFEVWRTKKPAVSNLSLNRVIALFAASSLLNASWMLVWQAQIMWLSAVLIAGLLVVLALIQRELAGKVYSWKEYVLTRLPFSVYFGWITVATIANISTFLVSTGWRGEPLSEGTWMVGVLLVGAVIGIVTAWRNVDPAYMAVFVWAYAGILLKHLDQEGHNGAYPTTIVTLSILLPIFIMLTLQFATRLRLAKK